jgi:hypothetical protein
MVSDLVRQPLEFSRCELLLREAGSWGRGQFGKPEKGERPALEAAIERRLVNIVTDWVYLVCPIVICEV